MKLGWVRGRVAPRVLLALLLAAPGCATVNEGPILQEIPITSAPVGAVVLVDGDPRGTTPTVIKLSPACEHRIQLYSPGYEGLHLVLQPELKPSAWGRAVLMTYLGVPAEAYRLAPGEVNVALRRLPGP